MKWCEKLDVKCEHLSQTFLDGVCNSPYVCSYMRNAPVHGAVAILQTYNLQLKIHRQNEEILKQNAEIVEKLNLLAQQTR